MSDLFDLFGKIDTMQIDYYKELSVDAKKQLPLFVVQRWLTGTSDAKQILLINNLLNTKIWEFHRHQDLVYKLLCVASTGKKTYKWIGKKKLETKPNILALLVNHYKCSKRDAKDFMFLLDDGDILEIADDCGIEKDILTKIKKELKK